MEKVYISEPRRVTFCLVCEEHIELDEYENPQLVVKICDKCKAAILKMRKQMETEVK